MRAKCVIYALAVGDEYRTTAFDDVGVRGDVVQEQQAPAVLGLAP